MERAGDTIYTGQANKEILYIVVRPTKSMWPSKIHFGDTIYTGQANVAKENSKFILEILYIPTRPMWPRKIHNVAK